MVPIKKKEGVMTTEELETVALTPEQIAQATGSYTGRYLRQVQRV